LGFFFLVAIDSHRFWIFPFGDLDKFTVKVYGNSARYREYENAWELLEKVTGKLSCFPPTSAYKIKI